jgi:hypothetical protein
MFVPLVAIPVLAVFGIPEFRSVSASGPNSAEGELFDPAIDVGIGESAHHSPEDLFAPIIEAGDSSTDESSQVSRTDAAAEEAAGNARGEHATADLGGERLEHLSDHQHAGAKHESVPSQIRGRTPFDGATTRAEPRTDNAITERDADIAESPFLGTSARVRANAFEGELAGSPFERTAKLEGESEQTTAQAKNTERLEGSTNSNTPRSPADSAAFSSKTDRNANEPADSGDSAADSGSSLTWRIAVRRLQDFGISDYQLQPGAQADAFHFSCVSPSKDNPRVTHRFEAEAGEPLDAVGKVLAQVEKWRNRRQ